VEIVPAVGARREGLAFMLPRSGNVIPDPRPAGGARIDVLLPKGN